MNAPVLPLVGPLEVDPTSAVYALVPAESRILDGLSFPAAALARAMLAAALADVERGAWDEQVITWLADKDVSTVATVASLLRRCWEAGVATGRAEVVDEQPTVADLRAEVDALARHLERTEAARVQAYGWWRDTQAERDEARQDVEDREAEVGRLRTDVAAADRDRNALTRVLATAVDVGARFDDGKVSAQGAFERLLAVITEAGGAR